VVRYHEGSVMVSAMRPDGKEGRLVANIPVSNLLICWTDVACELPK